MHPKIIIKRMAIAKLSPNQLKFRKDHKKHWDFFLEEAKVFRKIHGHCNISLKSNARPELARWAKKQRHHYKQYKQCLKGIYRPGERVCQLTPARVDALNDIGFCWDSHDVIWKERFNKLKEFYELNGHFNIPPGPKKNDPLAAWVRQQRYEYRLWKQGKNHCITVDRIEKLNGLGFVWNTKRMTKQS